MGEFQVLACIPLSGSVPVKDVADLAGVPETQLCRIARMMATAGFLREPEPGHLAHTTLSAPFVTKLFYLDAAMFLAHTAAPTALKMAAATKRQGASDLPAQETAYSLAFKTPQTFQATREQQVKLQRRWLAYARCEGDVNENVTELLSQLDWLSLGNACIVDVSRLIISNDIGMPEANRICPWEGCCSLYSCSHVSFRALSVTPLHRPGERAESISPERLEITRVVAI